MRHKYFVSVEMSLLFEQFLIVCTMQCVMSADF